MIAVMATIAKKWFPHDCSDSSDLSDRSDCSDHTETSLKVIEANPELCVSWGPGNNLQSRFKEH